MIRPRLLPPTQYRILATVYLLASLMTSTHPLPSLTMSSSFANLIHRFPHPLVVPKVPSLRLLESLAMAHVAHLTVVLEEESEMVAPEAVASEAELSELESLDFLTVVRITTMTTVTNY